MRKILPYILLFLSFPIFLFGQMDSIVLTADKLLLDDIRPSETAETKQQVFSATRSLTDLGELPFTVYVITKEEIRDNNYRTLVDALKMQPGIKSSQPGSAMEGETFLMRGLLGNSYTKILLNGNPIKPSAVRGMPIGAQIPIQQAERIEVIYGAAGTLFGADGSGGVINIVLEETERPVYTQANLSLGSNDFTNIDVSFGGRLGKRKNTLRYSLFGSYTYRNNLNIRHDNDTLFNPSKYNTTSLINLERLENFVRDTDNNILFNNFPHQSRLVGIQLAYKAMRLSIETMYRRDHSSIGLNPSAVSYTNPLNYIGERIINANFSIAKRKKRWGYDLRLQYLQYQMDNRSSHDYVLNTTADLLDKLSYSKSFDAVNGLDLAQYDSLTTWNFNRYFNGTRFSFAESLDANTSFVFYYYPKKVNMEITIGTSQKYLKSTPFVNYSEVPLSSNIFNDFNGLTTFDLSPFVREELDGFEIFSFGQLYWRLKKWTITSGVQWYRKGEFSFYSSLVDGGDIKTSTNFRAAVNYQMNKTWSWRAFYGTAFRAPPPFYKATTYAISLENIPKIQVAPNFLDTEQTETAEFGFRWIPNKKNFFDAVGFYSKSSNLVEYRLFQSQDSSGSTNFYTQGFFNTPQSRMLLYGAQLNYMYRSPFLDFGFNMTWSYGGEKENEFAEETNLRELPRIIRKTRIIVRPTSRISFTFDTIFNRKAQNKLGKEGRGDLPKFRTFDILANYNINRNFRVFFKTKNILNKEYAGLNATNTTDDLFYNPQEKFTFRLGMSYRVD